MVSCLVHCSWRDGSFNKAFRQKVNIGGQFEKKIMRFFVNIKHVNITPLKSSELVRLSVQTQPTITISAVMSRLSLCQLSDDYSWTLILSVCRFVSFMHLRTCAAVVCHFRWRRWWPSPDVQLYQCDLTNRKTRTGTGEQTGRKRGVHQTAHVQTWWLMHRSHFVAMSDVIYLVVFVLLLFMWNHVLSWDARHISKEYFYHDHHSFKLTDSVDVLHSAGGEVVVQHEVDSFEVDSSGEQSRADQYPNLTRAKTVHYVVPLKQNTKATGEEEKYKVALQKRTQYTVC